jgi:hypothetical protein
MQIENSKENIQPIAGGRNITTLASRVKISNAQRQPEQSKLDLEIELWEDRILTGKSEDPLSVWDEYIKWALQNFTGDKMAGNIVPLLQRCTRRFQCDKRYKNDVRYLNIWIKYIDTVHDPADIFSFLEANEIGKELAITYTSWALVLELKKGMYAEAYSKLEEGLKRRAVPLEQLQNALQQFQHRMNTRTMVAIQDAEYDAPQTNSAKTESREFGDQITKSRRLVKPAGTICNGSSLIAGLTSNVAKPSVKREAGNSGGFSVFIDSGHDGIAESPAAVQWSYLPTEKEKVKENIRSASQWTKDAAGTLPMKRTKAAAIRPAAPKAGIDFEMFVDEGLESSCAKRGVEVKPLRPVRAQLDGMAPHLERHARPLEFLRVMTDEGAAGGECEGRP